MENFLEQQWENMIRDLTSFVAIDSVYDPDSVGPHMPFGAKTRQALDYVLELGRRFGMEVRDYDGYAAELTVGSGDRMVGILCHADVVAAGDGWDTEPFTLVRRDGRLYGRGALDDKGPLISCLYAMHWLHTSGQIPENTSLRMIVGVDEEESWGCIRHYLDRAERLPDCSIVPDGNFPMIFCEKGLLDFDLVAGTRVNHGAAVRLTSLDCGGSRNIVPAVARCTLEAEDSAYVLSCLEGVEDVTESLENGRILVTARGKSTHCMSPEKGSNAIGKLFGALKKLGDDFSHSAFVQYFNTYLGMDYTGDAFGCAMKDVDSGSLTFNVGAAVMDMDGGITLQADVRYPASVSYETVRELLAQGALRAKMTYQEVDHLPPVHHAPTSKLVETLLDVYRTHTGDQAAQLLAIGGATYARALPGAVAFGPLFPWEEELAHEPNEFLSEESLRKMSLIYAQTLLRLMQE